MWNYRFFTKSKKKKKKRNCFFFFSRSLLARHVKKKTLPLKKKKKGRSFHKKKKKKKKSRRRPLRHLDPLLQHVPCLAGPLQLLSERDPTLRRAVRRARGSQGDAGVEVEGVGDGAPRAAKDVLEDRGVERRVAPLEVLDGARGDAQLARVEPFFFRLFIL